MRGDAGRAHPRRPRQPVQPGLHLPQGLDPRQAPRRPRPAARAAGAPGRRSGHRHLGRGVVGRGLRRDRAWARSRSSSEHGRDAVALYLGNPSAHTLAGILYNGDRRPEPGQPQPVLGLHRRPDAQARVQRAAVRRAAAHPGARPRSHRLPAHAGRQPLGVERLALHRARLPRSGQGDPGPGRQGRGGRPPPQPHRRGGRRARGRSGPAPTPTCWSPWSHVLFAEGLVDLGRLAPHVAGVDELRAAVAPFTPRRWPAPSASTPRTSAGWPASSRPRRRAAVYGRIGTRTVEFGTVASWAVDVLNVLTGNLDRPGGAMFPLAAHERDTTAGHGPRLRHRAAPQPGQGLPRGHRRAARRHPGRRDRDAGRGPGPGPGHRRRQPGAVDPQQPAGSTRRSARSTSWSASTSTSTRPPGTPT